jgi:hypothetical protein
MYINLRYDLNSGWLCCLFLLSSCFLYARQDAVLLNHETIININANKITKGISYKIRINSRSGDEYARVNIVKSGLSQISDIEAKITDISGNAVRKLKSSEIKRTHLITDAAFFQDNYLYEFELSHYDYPYILEYSYTEKENQFVDIEFWRPVLSYDIETVNASLKMVLPVDYAFKTILSNINPPQVDTLDNKLQLTWNASFKPLSEPEKLMPPQLSFFPTARIIPQQFHFGSSGTFADWKSYGQWQYETNHKLQNLPESAVAAIKSLINPCRSDEEKIRILFHKLQDETRYVNISTETGGLIPMSATEVSEKKYGDCKALSNYFQAVLAVAGIYSIYTDIYAGEKRVSFFPDIPAQQFNHVILCVPLKTDTLWIDCTSDGPMGKINAFIQGRVVLLIENHLSRLSKIPSLKAEENLQERYIITSTDSTGQQIAVFQNRYRGMESMMLKEISNMQHESERRKNIHKHFAVDQTDLLDYQILPHCRDEDTVSLKLQVQLSEKLQRAGNDDLMHFFPLDIPVLQKPGLRKYPLQIDIPVFKKDVQIIKRISPAGFNVRDLVIEAPYGKYSRKVEVFADNIRLTKSFEIYSGNYPLSAYPDFYSFIRAVREAESFSILINKSKDL